ncbi:transposase, partial [Xanthomonas oryzae pv. oryzae]
LREDVSPEQIAGRTGLASHAGIYRHIDADQKRDGRLFMHLRKRRRKRRRRGVRVRAARLLIATTVREV